MGNNKPSLPQVGFSALLLAAVLGALACQARGQAGSGDESTARPVRTVAVGTADIVDKLTVPAELLPYTEVRIFSQIPDRILWFPFRDGDFVKRGQRLALIRREGLQQGLERMVAEEQALRVQVANLEQELRRSRDLLASGVITQPAFDKLQTTFRSTRARLQALQAGRRQMEVQAGNAVIRSPISGVVAGVQLEPGDMAVPQVPLCRVLEIARLRVRLRLTEDEAVRVRPQQQVRLYLDCCPGESFPAQVNRIHPYIDPATRTNVVEVVLENPTAEQGQYRLKPGMFGKAEIIIANRQGVVAVPEQALLLDNEIIKKQQTGQMLRLALVVEDGLARRRVVELGARQGRLVEIRRGLQAGEQLIVQGQHGLRDGERVRVVGKQ